MNQELFEQFYRTHFGKTVNRLRHASLSKEDSEDLTQEIFEDLFVRDEEKYILKEGLFWWFVNNRLYNFVQARDTKELYKKYWEKRGKQEVEFWTWFEEKQELLQSLLGDRRECAGIKVKDAVSFILENGLYATQRKYGKRWQKIVNFIKEEK